MDRQKCSGIRNSYLGYPVPDYIHLPLALNAQGNKLSKQNHAPALPDGDPRSVLLSALRFLNQPVPEQWQDMALPRLLQWAISHWSLASIPLIGVAEATSAFSKVAR